MTKTTGEMSRVGTDDDRLCTEINMEKKKRPRWL